MSRRPRKHEHCHEDPFPAKTKVLALLQHEECPDSQARVTGKPKEKVLPPGNSFFRVTQLFGGTTKVIAGVRVIHRRPTGLQEVHIHTAKPAEMLAFMDSALTG